MIMQMDRIIYVRDKGNFIVGGIKKEKYNEETLNKLKGNKIWVEGKNGNRLILDVIDVQPSISFNGDYIVGIGVKQSITDNDVKKHTQVYIMD